MLLRLHAISFSTLRVVESFSGFDPSIITEEARGLLWQGCSGICGW
jgi:hypothetical protein